MSRREELSEKRTSMTTANNHAGPLEGVGIEFIEENGGGPGVRLRASKKGEVEGIKNPSLFRQRLFPLPESLDLTPPAMPASG
jgi:hypothetical protein